MMDFGVQQGSNLGSLFSAGYNLGNLHILLGEFEIAAEYYKYVD